MSRDRIRLALDVYAAASEREEADAAWDRVDPSDERAFEDACTRRQDARDSELRALRAYFTKTCDRRELAQWTALAVCQLTF